jgi:membrane associated rhomboid family serine protease
MILSVVVFILFNFLALEEVTNEDVVVLFGAFDTQYVAKGYVWLLLTSAFVHFSLIHLIFNMTAYYQLGRIIEQFYSEKVIISVFVLSAIVGSLFTYIGSVLLDTDILSIGASGGVFGMLGLIFAGSVRNVRYGAGLPIPKETFYPTIALSILISFLPFVNWLAHLGGFLMGFGLGYLLKTSNDSLFDPSDRYIKIWTYRLALGALMVSFSMFFLNIFIG